MKAAMWRLIGSALVAIGVFLGFAPISHTYAAGDSSSCGSVFTGIRYSGCDGVQADRIAWMGVAIILGVVLVIVSRLHRNRRSGTLPTGARPPCY